MAIVISQLFIKDYFAWLPIIDSLTRCKPSYNFVQIFEISGL